jgi:succinate dehydrogenase/fumarate reductase iron-sulfur protein
MRYSFRILRFDPLVDRQPYFQEYGYETSEKKSILEALMDIRNDQDCSLAFRYSCREAVCGSCGMVINGQFDLACRTMLEALGTTLVSSPPNLESRPDRWAFLEKLYSVDHSSQTRGPRGYRIETAMKRRPVRHASCGLCCNTCPVVSRDQGYGRRLTKLYQFIRTPGMEGAKRWFRVNSRPGLGCDTVFRCNEASRYVPAGRHPGVRRASGRQISGFQEKK